jgi:hypothetical protein
MNLTLTDAFTAARQRGKIRARTAFDQPDNLRLEDAAAYAHCEPAVIEAARQLGELYALVSPTSPRELRYPNWQFKASAQRLTAVLLPFVQAHANCFVIHQFMLGVHGVPDIPTPAQIILDSDADIEPVIRLAIDYLNADQGAS